MFSALFIIFFFLRGSLRTEGFCPVEVLIVQTKSLEQQKGVIIRKKCSVHYTILTSHFAGFIFIIEKALFTIEKYQAISKSGFSLQKIYRKKCQFLELQITLFYLICHH